LRASSEERVGPPKGWSVRGNAVLPDSNVNASTRAEHAPASPQPTRRDFIYIATATVGAVGAAAALVPFIGQMNPDASTLAAGGPVELDLGKVATGQQVVIRWRERPIFVFHRTPQILSTLRDKALVEQLADPDSKEVQQPPYAANWHRSITPEFSVLVGICTHLGCIPLFYPQPNASAPAAGWRGGYFCPCHGSKYDAAGRVFNGVPAPYNLPVPPYRLVNATTLRVGENPSDTHFDFATIRQM
jgi:ubiquinol-cytochrome c reductase iron-sulfur subunit